jgi:hypothetical protein
MHLSIMECHVLPELDGAWGVDTLMNIRRKNGQMRNAFVVGC